MTKVFTIAHVPDGLEQAWLQHLRDFDITHKGRCHFDVVALAPDLSFEQMIEALRVEPPLPEQAVFERERKMARCPDGLLCPRDYERQRREQEARRKS